MKLTRTSPACDREHYQCPRYHRWNGERVGIWALSAIGLMFLASVVLMVILYIWTATRPKSPEVQKAKIEAEAKDKADFTKSCERVGKWADTGGSRYSWECKR